MATSPLNANRLSDRHDLQGLLHLASITAPHSLCSHSGLPDIRPALQALIPKSALDVRGLL